MASSILSKWNTPSHPSYLPSSHCTFQLTHPCGVRHDSHDVLLIFLIVSTHAPLQGATFMAHPPVHRHVWIADIIMRQIFYFSSCFFIFSISSMAMRRQPPSRFCSSILRRHWFQLTHLCEVRPAWYDGLVATRSDFNSRTSARCDSRTFKQLIFNHLKSYFREPVFQDVLKTDRFSKNHHKSLIFN